MDRTQASPTEHIDSRTDWRAEATIDADQRQLKGIALAGTDSTNGYRYTEAALQAAVPLYDGRHVYIGNPQLHRSGITPPARHPRDLAGIIRQPRYERGRIRGDITVFRTEAGDTLLALAEANPPNVGMSQVVLAEGTRDELTKIHEVTCVELVLNPATVHNFTESKQGKEEGAGEIGQLRRELASLRQLVETRTGPTSQSRQQTTPPATDDDFIRAIKDR